MAAAFVAPPADLKALAPFLQRAHETRTADPALSYWCNYHAAQLGIPLLAKLQPASKSFLIQLMDTLEAQKKSLSDNDIVNGDDLVAKAYVENTALKVFAGADNEDRSGKANKATARRFLAAANFIEVLSNFGPLENHMEEKLRYAKWKAADIAKALREGRQPTPGAPGEEGEEEERANVEALTGTEQAADRLAGLSAAHPDEEDQYVARELAKLQGVDAPTPAAATAITPPHEEQVRGASDPTRPQASREQSRLSYDGRARSEKDGAEEGDPFQGTSSPNFSRPLSTASPSPSLGESGGTFAAFHSINGTTSPSPRPLPQPPTPSSAIRREGLPMPPGGQGSVNPLVPPSHLFSPGLSPSIPSSSSQTFLPPPPQPQIPAAALPSAPPAAAVAPPSMLQPSAPTEIPDLPSTLDHLSIARVQKLSKWAVSALDYEDVETARRHLREALDICEGRAPLPGKK